MTLNDLEQYRDMRAEADELRKCMEKECRHFRRNVEHEYWKQRELRKQRKRGETNANDTCD